MKYVSRYIEPLLLATLKKGKSILLLGPRQTGKTTVINRLPFDLFISLIQPPVRQRYEKNIGLLIGEIEALAEQEGRPVIVVIDEVQKLPVVMDVAQDLVDRKIAIFVLTGSSARKLKRHEHINLLPGRVIPYVMDPLSYPEIDIKKYALEDLLLYGALPEVALTKKPEDKDELLRAYVSIYLEEEVRAEALVRDLPSFAKFLTLAASESGNPVNYLKLSQEIGVAHSTIKSYYQILDDCLVVERIEPYTKSSVRKKLQRSQKYIFFDLGVRKIAAEEGNLPKKETLGKLFEQFVALELLKTVRVNKANMQLYYWRDADGPEVDWVLSKEGELIPIEVKWTDSPSLKDAKHLATFIHEYDEATHGYVVCRTPRKVKLSDQVDALPWAELYNLIG